MSFPIMVVVVFVPIKEAIALKASTSDLIPLSKAAIAVSLTKLVESIDPAASDALQLSIIDSLTDMPAASDALQLSIIDSL